MSNSIFTLEMWFHKGLMQPLTLRGCLVTLDLEMIVPFPSHIAYSYVDDLVIAPYDRRAS